MEKVIIRAPMVRKAANATVWQNEVDEWQMKDVDIIVEKTIEVDTKDFDSMMSNFFKYRIVVCDNVNHMWMDEKGWHVVAITCKERPITILIESEGYDYYV